MIQVCSTGGEFTSRLLEDVNRCAKPAKHLARRQEINKAVMSDTEDSLKKHQELTAAIDPKTSEPVYETSSIDMSAVQSSIQKNREEKQAEADAVAQGEKQPEAQKTPSDMSDQNMEKTFGQWNQPKQNPFAQTMSALSAMGTQSVGALSALAGLPKTSALPAANAAPSTTEISPNAEAVTEQGQAGWSGAKKPEAAHQQASVHSIRYEDQATGSSRMRPTSASTAGQPMMAGVGTSNNSGSFGNGAGAQLDPQVTVARPSDLPANFRLEAPNASGGSNPGAAAPGSAGPTRSNLADYLPTGSHYRNRGPAGLQRNNEIRAQSADIWQIISIRFRSRCAEGRLMDCANHLSKK